MIGLLGARAVSAANFVVDTTSDTSLSACTAAAADCSLRGAMFAANNLAGGDAITFSIPGSDPGCSAETGVCRIEIGTALPAINQPLSIDGYTQPGAQPNTIPAPGANNAQLKIELTRSGIFVPNNVFQLNGTATLFELRGLAIFTPTSGMVSGGLRHVIRGNWFGVTALGESPDYSSPGTVFELGFFNRQIIIGGSNPEDRNVIAGSGRDLSSPPLPGGGTNIVRVNSVMTDRGDILIEGNLIGFAPDGITSLPFRDPFSVNPGDDAFQTPTVRILDNRFSRAARNFSGAFGGALRIMTNRTMTEAAVIQGNIFGLGVDGSRVGVQKDHIEIFLGNNSRVPKVLIGGLGVGEGNVFAAGASFGVDLGSAVRLPNSALAGTFIEFVGNRMLGNQGIGLDFPHPTAGGGVAFGRTLNDVDDVDLGANQSQNFPVISAFSVAGDQLNLTYGVDSAPANSAYPLRVDFYRALGDEGEELIDSDVYLLTEAQTSKSVTFTLPPGFDLDADDVVVAVATDAEGRSSEFSFGQLQITVSDAPDPFPAGIPFSVEVVATATSGPFKPNGTVLVSMNTSPATTCTMTLQPTATALTSAGSCELLPLQVGSRTITATYQTLAGAFSSATGDNVTAIAAHTVTDPGPEQISFASCAAVGIEGRELVVEVRRPSGGVAAVQVDLTHEAGTATPGTDYAAPADQTLIWAPGDFAPKLIGIPIDADALVEPVETFRLRLSNPVNASILPTALTEIRIRNGVDAGFADGFEGSCVN